MKLSIAVIAYLETCLKLVKDKAPEVPVYSLKAYKYGQWVVINQWDDIGHVASLLVQYGIDPDHQTAIDRLIKS